MISVLLATRNKGKIREIKDILKNLHIKILLPEEIGIDDKIEETGSSFTENALIKAKNLGEKSGILTIAEDSGLEIDALKGAPGIYSARYAEGSDNDRIKKVLYEMKGVPDDKRTARFRSVVVLYDPSLKKNYIFEGLSEGKIIHKPEGKGGFGYDPIFFNNDLGKTNAQASDSEKNRVSHRFRALVKSINTLMTYIKA